MAIATTPAVRYTKCDKSPTAQNYLDLSDINYFNHELPDMDKNLNKRYGSQMIDGWFEKQVVKALTLVMLSLGQKRTD
jgi:hypothetical protein